MYAESKYATVPYGCHKVLFRLLFLINCFDYFIAVPPAEKEAWVARGEADKARYLQELATYEPPPGYDAKGDAIITAQPAKGRRGKPEKDPNAPKRNMSAYLLYQNAMREQFKRENPGML